MPKDSILVDPKGAEELRFWEILDEIVKTAQGADSPGRDARLILLKKRALAFPRALAERIILLQEQLKSSSHSE